MIMNLPADVFLQSSLDNHGMVLRQHPSQQRPIIDLLVAMIAVPVLIMCALQLEKNMQERWAESAESRWLVFGLGISMLLISVLICGYVTHRMGVCMWAGPLEDTSLSTNSSFAHINSQNDILRIVDTLPPSYESVVKFDIPPPPYDHVVINMENNIKDTTNCKDAPMEATSMHI